MFELHIYFGSPCAYGIPVTYKVFDDSCCTLYRNKQLFYGYSKKDIIQIIKQDCRDNCNCSRFNTKIF